LRLALLENILISVETNENQEKGAKPGLTAMGLGALGIVFGDIGTSPLYTLKTVLDLTGHAPTEGVVLGVLSLLLWTLIIVTSIKYVIFAMSIDNDGEGGILALMALLGIKKHRRPVLVALGLFGAALIYGDGAITPAISVLSALEGLKIVAPALDAWVLPTAVTILVALFALQPMGTARIGRAFGPIMLLWFAAIAGLGLRGVLQHPGVLLAFNPVYAVRYLFSNGLTSFLVMGGVFLCVTGAEALYADMGHFGARPIRLSWSFIVFPSLVLNYAGQCAIVLNGAATDDNIFYLLCPTSLMLPFVVLATVATIIASQSIITGAFSMTRQAIQLGWLPRLRIVQTSEEGYGQIYVGAVNWLLMAVTIGLTLLFKKSDNLAAAYGIAVSATMLMTSGLLFIAMREVWNWSLAASAAVAGVFICIDTAFFLANSAKIADGGYVPLLLASSVYAVMVIWHRGSVAVTEQMHGRTKPLDAFLASLEAQNIPRVPGAGIFLTRTTNDVPPVMLWHVERNEALHRRLLVLSITTLSIPRVDEAERLSLVELAPDFWRATAQFGFMEKPDVAGLIERARAKGCGLPLDRLTYYVGRETVVCREDGEGHPEWETALFAAMARNASHVSDFLRLPNDCLVEIGRQVAI
jgi:KUP system potassium uptake protein